MEQLFVSIAVPQFEETIITAGKFNSPFGVEPRDFWDRVSGSRSLLFQTQPQDLVGLMASHRIANTNLILRAMLVNGYFADTGLDNNEQPSAAFMLEYLPSDDLSIAGTYWYGPEFDKQVGEKLHFVNAQIIWFMTDRFLLAGECQHASTDSPTGVLDWRGFLALANYDLSETFRCFVQWSLLNDRGGFQTGTAEKTEEINVGFDWYLHPQVEVRSEYRHDYRPVRGDRDHWDAHLTFGF